jgi:hypothetical protein
MDREAAQHDPGLVQAPRGVAKRCGALRPHGQANTPGVGVDVRLAGPESLDGLGGPHGLCGVIEFDLEDLAPDAVL